LQRGDAGVLKVSASPQHIESVQATVLHRYVQRYPDVQVKLIEAAERDTMTMLARQEIHLGQNLVPILEPDDRRFGSLPLQHVELLAACHPSLFLGKENSIEISRLGQTPPPAALCRGVLRNARGLCPGDFSDYSSLDPQATSNIIAHVEPSNSGSRRWGGCVDRVISYVFCSTDHLHQI
jgi:DNA-binding transcriptional LysR family regulator